MKKLKCFQTGATEGGPFSPNGACQAAEKGPTKKKLYHFEFRIQIEQGSLLHTKLLRSKVPIVGIGPR